MTKINNLISEGMLFPEFVFLKILNRSDKKQIERDILKKRIESFVKSRKKVFLSDIIDTFSLDLGEAVSLVKELREEGRIKEV